MKFCHQCGTSLEEGDRFCPHCGQMVRGMEGAGPIKPSGDAGRSSLPESPPLGLEYKGVGIRFVAYLIDMIPILIFYFIIGRFTAGLVGGQTDEGFALHGLPALIVIVLTTLFGLAYFVLLEKGWNGQTPGKRLTSIQVVREDGGPLDFSAALIRNVLRIVDGLFIYLVGAILIWRSPLKQRLGDRIGHTVVIKARRSAATQNRKKRKITFGSTSDTDYLNMSD